MSDYLLSTDLTIGQSDKDKPRTFTGVANSGKPFDYFGTRAVVELSSVQLTDKIPVLALHDRNLRLGVGALSIVNNELVINGTLLTNDEAVKLAKDADDGFPLQLSAHLTTDDYTDLKEGESVKVNDILYQYPLRILKNCAVREVSFTPTGVDRHTTAMILSQSQPKENSMKDDPKSAPKADENSDLLAQIAELTAQVKQLTAENAQLKADKQKVKVDAKLSANGFKKDENGNYQGLSSVTLNFLLSLDDKELDSAIGDFAKKQPNAKLDFLLGEQYGNATAPQTEENPLLADAKSRKA